MNCSKLVTSCLAALARGFGEAGFEHGVLCHGIDDLLVLLLEREDQLAEPGIAEGFDGGLRQLACYLGLQFSRSGVPPLRIFLGQAATCRFYIRGMPFDVLFDVVKLFGVSDDAVVVFFLPGAAACCSGVRCVGGLQAAGRRFHFQDLLGGVALPRMHDR